MVEQDVREAAQEWDWLTEQGSTPEFDAAEHLLQAFARMKEAGRREGLRQAAEVLQKRADGHFADEHTDAMFACDEARKAITALMGDEK